MNIKTLNSRLRAFYDAGFTKSDIDDLIDVDDFFPTSDLTDAGYVSKKLPQSKIDEIGAQLPKFKDVKTELLESIQAEENPKILTKTQAKERLVNEFRAKNVLLDTISSSAARYYDLVREIADKYDKNLQKAESLLVSTPSGMKLANANSRAGEIQNSMKYKNPAGSYLEAYNGIKNYEELANAVLRELEAMYKGVY